MEVPQIAKVKIIRSKKAHGYQYSITIPVDYGRTLDKMGVENLVIAFDRAFSGVPETDPEAEKFLLAFLMKHPELRKFFTLQKVGSESETPQNSHSKPTTPHQSEAT